MEEFFRKVLDVVPRIRTRLQLGGLALAIAGFLIGRVIAPDSVPAQASIGAIGIALIVFAHLFHFLRDFPARSRASLVIALFGFLVFSAAMLWIALSLAGDGKRQKALIELRNLALEISPPAFLDAIKAGNPRIVELYLDAGLPVDGAEGAVRPMILAAKGRNSDVLKILLERKGYVNLTDADDTPLTAAIAANRLENVQLLLSSGADPNREPSLCRTPISLAFASSQMFDMLIKSGARIRSGKDCASALLLAVQRGNAGIVRKVLEAGVDINERSGRIHVTALMVASGGQHGQSNLELMRLLLDKGAQPDLRDDHGQTALFHAVSGESIDAVTLLLSKGANPNIPDEVGFSPLLQATLKGPSTVMNALLAAGANPNAPTDSGIGPLHFGLRTSAPHCERVVILLKAGADPKWAAKDGRLPLDGIEKYEGKDCEEANRLLRSGGLA